MSQTASSAFADPCGVCPAWVDGSPVAKTSKDLRRGCPAESPAPRAEPGSVSWISAWSAEIYARILFLCCDTEQQSSGREMDKLLFFVFSTESL